MPRILALTLASLFISSPALADRYEFDPEHTNIVFFVNHLGFSDMLGRFTTYDGFFTFDQAEPEKSSVEVSLKPRGVKTSSSLLDDVLQGEQFFNTEKFPKLTFKSTSVQVTGANTGDITGDLTMLGITKPVVLHVKFHKADYHPYSGHYVAGFEADATIKRSDFGMTAYIPAVGDEVKLVVQTEGINVDRDKALEKKH